MSIYTVAIIIGFLLVWTIEGFRWSVRNLEEYKVRSMLGDYLAFWYFIFRGGPFNILIAVFFLPTLIFNTLRSILRRI